MDDPRIVSMKWHNVRLISQERLLRSITGDELLGTQRLAKGLLVHIVVERALCTPEKVLTDSCGDAIKLCGAFHNVGRLTTTLEQQMQVQ